MAKPLNNELSSDLMSRICHLQSLLENLAQSLPMDPKDSTYDFGLDKEMVDEKGVWFAFNRKFEVCFETHNLAPGETIAFRERERCQALVEMIRLTIKELKNDVDRESLRTVWLERLIGVAELQRATSPKRKRTVELDQNDGPGCPAHVGKQPREPFKSPLFEPEFPSVTVGTVPVHHMRPAPDPSVATDPSRQLTFDDLKWKPFENEKEKGEQWRRVQEAYEEQRRKEEEKAARDQRRRKLATERQRRFRQRQREAKAAQKLSATTAMGDNVW